MPLDAKTIQCAVETIRTAADQGHLVYGQFCACIEHDPQNNTTTLQACVVGQLGWGVLVSQGGEDLARERFKRGVTLSDVNQILFDAGVSIDELQRLQLTKMYEDFDEAMELPYKYRYKDPDTYHATSRQLAENCVATLEASVSVVENGEVVEVARCEQLSLLIDDALTAEEPMPGEPAPTQRETVLT